MNQVIVKLTKISGKKDSKYQPGFAIEGPETKPPSIGERYRLDGYIRNSNGERWDFFYTTELLSIEGDFLFTQNSTWKREVLKGKNEQASG